MPNASPSVRLIFRFKPFILTNPARSTKHKLKPVNYNLHFSPSIRQKDGNSSQNFTLLEFFLCTYFTLRVGLLSWATVRLHRLHESPTNPCASSHSCCTRNVSLITRGAGGDSRTQITAGSAVLIAERRQMSDSTLYFGSSRAWCVGLWG